MTPVTTYYLEMSDPSQLKPAVCDDPCFRVEEVSGDRWQINKSLYEIVGKDWKWIDKLPWTNQQWRDYAGSCAIRTFIAYYQTDICGYFELSTHDNEVEIIYFGLVPDFVGRKLGAPLLTRALNEAWQMKPKRVWVHTCTLDHPAAMKNYEDRGMTLYKTETEDSAVNEEN